MPATYIKKDGTVSVYDTKRYNEKFKANNADGYLCETCNRRMNRSHIKYHEQTAYHLRRVGTTVNHAMDASEEH